VSGGGDLLEVMPQAPMQRNPTLTNAGLRAIQRGSGQWSFVNLTFEAIPYWQDNTCAQHLSKVDTA